MAQHNVLLFLLTIGTTVLAAPQFDKYTIKFEQGVSQASIGFFIQPLSTTSTNNQYADWIMDFENQRLRFTLGNPSLPSLQLYALSTMSYVIEMNTTSNSLYCISTPVTFQSVLGAYMYPYVRYLGDATIGNQMYRMYAGVSPDPVTQTSISNVALVSTTTTAFAQMPIMSPNGFIYYAFPSVTIGTPPASYFTVPSICGASNVTCSPACGSNAQCVNQTCVCYKGFYGNATNGCVANVSTPQLIGSMNVTYDEYVLQIGTDAVSQTCVGTYTNPITNASVYSAWVQNLENKTIRWDHGTPGVSGSVSYYFMPNFTYTVTYTSNSTSKCNTTKQMNFTQALNNMFYPTMRYMGQTTYNNVPCRMYAGTGIPNPNTAATGMIKFISAYGSRFYLLAMLNTQGYTYYDYPNVTLGTPTSSWFNLPAICTGINLPLNNLEGSGNVVKPLSPLGLVFLVSIVLTMKMCQV